ncbi:MAG: DUF6599 family protein [bacterium]
MVSHQKRNPAVTRMAIAAILSLSFTALGCSSNSDSPGSYATDRFLPETLGESGTGRSSDIRVFCGDSLWEYINGGAELYHQFNFVEVATADYRTGNIEFTADIYRFDNAVNAFGLYTSLRPDNCRPAALGVAGFVSTASIHFVRGNYLVQLTGFDRSEATDNALAQAAEQLDQLLPGTTSLPETFGEFPSEGAVPVSERYFAQSYLGYEFLSQIYTRRFITGPDTTTLFLCLDNPEGCFLQWSQNAVETSTIESAGDDFPFDEGRGFYVDDIYSGRILVGIFRGRMIGMTNCTSATRKLMLDWLASLSTASQL